MTFRIMLFALLLLQVLAGTAWAREIPPVTLDVSGEASPELLADFRQALRRMANRQPDQKPSQTMAASTERVDPDQFWKVEEGVAYTADETSPRQRLDIVYPFEGEPPYPVIVHFHSGDWQTGHRQSASDSAVYWAIYQGYALVNVGYRLADDAHWPAQLHDARAALRFLRANADQYQLDAGRMVAWGSGSGGHLAQMLAATNGDPVAEAPDMGQATASSAVQGVVSWSGVSDLSDMAPETRELADQLLDAFAYQSDAGLDASPVANIHADFPPILLVHGTSDTVVPFEQSARMAIRVNAVTGKQQAQLILRINAGHRDPRIADPGVMAQSLDFVDDILFADSENPHRSSFFPAIQTFDAETTE